MLVSRPIAAIATAINLFLLAPIENVDVLNNKRCVLNQTGLKTIEKAVEIINTGPHETRSEVYNWISSFLDVQLNTISILSKKLPEEKAHARKINFLVQVIDKLNYEFYKNNQNNVQNLTLFYDDSDGKPYIHQIAEKTLYHRENYESWKNAKIIYLDSGKVNGIMLTGRRGLVDYIPIFPI